MLPVSQNSRKFCGNIHKRTSLTLQTSEWCGNCDFRICICNLCSFFFISCSSSISLIRSLCSVSACVFLSVSASFRSFASSNFSALSSDIFSDALTAAERAVTALFCCRYGRRRPAQLRVACPVDITELMGTVVPELAGTGTTDCDAAAVDSLTV